MKEAKKRLKKCTRACSVNEDSEMSIGIQSIRNLDKSSFSGNENRIEFKNAG